MQITRLFLFSATSCLVLLACGDDTGSGGSASGGGGSTSDAGADPGGGGSTSDGGTTANGGGGGTADGGGTTDGGGGAGECVASGSGSADDVDCADVCADIVATGCGPSLQECEAVCPQLKACDTFDNFIDCAGAQPEWECVGDNLEPAECKEEWASCGRTCLPDMK